MCLETVWSQGVTFFRGERIPEGGSSHAEGPVQKVLEFGLREVDETSIKLLQVLGWNVLVK